jgi:hypothetical protein
MALKLIREDLLALYLFSFILFVMAIALVYSPHLILDVSFFWAISVGVIVYGLRKSSNTAIVIGCIISALMMVGMVISTYSTTSGLFGSSLPVLERILSFYQMNQFWFVPVIGTLLNSSGITLVPDQYRQKIIPPVSARPEDEKKSLVKKETSPLQKTIDSDNQFKNAQRFYDMQNYEQALQYCKKALDLNYYNRDAWYLKGQILQTAPTSASVLTSEWLVCYNRCLDCEPRNIDEWKANVELARYLGSINVLVGDSKVNSYIEKAERRGIFLTGKILANAFQWEGHGSIQVTNNTGEDCVVVLARENTRYTVKAFTLRSHDTFVIGSIPENTYTLYCVMGKKWNYGAKKFDENEHCKYFPYPLAFSEEWIQTYGRVALGVSYDIHSTRMSFTLPKGFVDLPSDQRPRLEI